MRISNIVGIRVDSMREKIAINRVMKLNPTTRLTHFNCLFNPHPQTLR